MSQREKLLQSIIDNPKDVRFADACRAAELIGFEAKGQSGTSHNSFSKSGDPVGLNFQNLKGGKIAPYQARQLGTKIQEYLDKRAAAEQAKRDAEKQSGKKSQ